ncbi:MAG: cache domain-containing protein [Desulfovibrionales bacterium]
MLILLLAVSLVPLGVLWGIDFRNTTNRIQRDTELLMAETASGLGKQVDEWVDKNMRILKLAAKMPEIRSMDRSRQETVLRSIHEEYPWMYLVFTLDSTGMNLSRNDGKALRDYSDRQYYKDVTAGKTVAWQTLIGKTSHKPALVIATPIKEYGETVGVMAAAMTINDITDKVAGWKQGQTGFAFLVDENNTVVVHPNSQYVLERKDISKHPLLATFRETGEPLTKIFQEQESEVRALGHMVGLNHEWALAIQQQDSEVFAALRKDKISALILLVSTILVVVVLSVLASRAIVNPIKHLTDVAERMSLGDLEAKINVRSKDEIGQLAMALSRMQYSLSLAMSRFRKRS